MFLRSNAVRPASPAELHFSSVLHSIYQQRLQDATAKGASRAELRILRDRLKHHGNIATTAQIFTYEA